MSVFVKSLLLALATALLAASPAAAAGFGLTDLEVRIEPQEGILATQAGSHPGAIVTQVGVETELDPGSGKVVPVEEAKDLDISFPAGLVGNPTAAPQCPPPEFLAGKSGECSDASAVGIAEVEFGEPGKIVEFPVFNLEPSPGVAAKLGFIVEDRAPVVIDIGLNPSSPNNVVVHTGNISQALFFLRAEVTVWGVPTADAHDADRGSCLREGGSCPVSLPEVPFLTLPASCDKPLTFGFRADSWQNPGQWFETTASVEEGGQALSPTGCDKLDFTPEVSAQPTTTSSGSASGLDFGIDFDDPGLTSATGISQARVRKAVVTLPEGMTLNPSAAAGLETCTQAELARETASTTPGEGCPQAAKVGEVEVETPLLEGKLLEGSLYVATPYENPFGSLIAIYMVIEDPELGILVKLAGKVLPDPVSGQLVTTFEDVPEVPFSRFDFHFRSGPRAPLITPSRCGAHTASVVLTPSSGAAPLTQSAGFLTTSGPGGGPCPAGGVPPFNPGFEAGSLASAAGAFSPFYMRLTRADGEQDMTRFSSLLPPGVTGKIAGVARCAQAAIEAAKQKSGRSELASPSCPEASRIGATTTGAGVGSQLTWVSGSIYLSGPYKGAPLSVVAIVPAVAGPFDVGTVVVQEGLDLDPVSAQVEVDGAASDPIPHILAGIPLSVRDLRVYVDRDRFTLNPTSCEPSATRATLFGSFLDVFNPADDVPAQLSARYQASSCASLGFAPKLSLRLKGGTRRAAHPALTAILKTRVGDANIGKAAVTLPHSAFLEQGHIRTICTRVQFAAHQCPAGSIYGEAIAKTPLLDGALSGPVYLRSSNHDLPDMVVALKGPAETPIEIELVGRIDSVNGGIRSTFESTPDAPVSEFVLRMQGGKKGLIVNSRDLCLAKSRADVRFTGHNGKLSRSRPVVRASCAKKKAGKAKRRGR